MSTLADPVTEALHQGLYTRVIGRRVVHYQRLGSTMDEAARLAEAAADDGTVVVAEEQTGGRGRFQRAWVSPPGNLYLSVVLRPLAGEAAYLGMIAALAVVRAVGRVTGRVPSIRWPNDVMMEGKKVGGILLESALEGERVRYAVLGIGLNVHLDVIAYPEIAERATSLLRETGAEVSRGTLLKHLLEELDALYLGLRRGERPLTEWRGCLETLGRQVTVRWGPQVEEGVAEDVDEVGNLVLRRRDGSQVTLPAGEVSSHT